jgi:hypothetical protein
MHQVKESVQGAMVRGSITSLLLNDRSSLSMNLKTLTVIVSELRRGLEIFNDCCHLK